MLNFFKIQNLNLFDLICNFILKLHISEDCSVGFYVLNNYLHKFYSFDVIYFDTSPSFFLLNPILSNISFKLIFIIYSYLFWHYKFKIELNLYLKLINFKNLNKSTKYIYLNKNKLLIMGIILFILYVIIINSFILLIIYDIKYINLYKLLFYSLAQLFAFYFINFIFTKIKIDEIFILVIVFFKVVSDVINNIILYEVTSKFEHWDGNINILLDIIHATYLGCYYSFLFILKWTMGILSTKYGTELIWFFIPMFDGGDIIFQPGAFTKGFIPHKQGVLSVKDNNTTLQVIKPKKIKVEDRLAYNSPLLKNITKFDKPRFYSNIELEHFKNHMDNFFNIRAVVKKEGFENNILSDPTHAFRESLPKYTDSQEIRNNSNNIKSKPVNHLSTQSFPYINPNKVDSKGATSSSNVYSTPPEQSLPKLADSTYGNIRDTGPVRIVNDSTLVSRSFIHPVFKIQQIWDIFTLNDKCTYHLEGVKKLLKYDPASTSTWVHINSKIHSVPIFTALGIELNDNTINTVLPKLTRLDIDKIYIAIVTESEDQAIIEEIAGFINKYCTNVSIKEKIKIHHFIRDSYKELVVNLALWNEAIEFGEVKDVNDLIKYSQLQEFFWCKINKNIASNQANVSAVICNEIYNSAINTFNTKLTNKIMYPFINIPNTTPQIYHGCCKLLFSYENCVLDTCKLLELAESESLTYYQTDNMDFNKELMKLKINDVRQVVKSIEVDLINKNNFAKHPAWQNELEQLITRQQKVYVITWTNVFNLNAFFAVNPDVTKNALVKEFYLHKFCYLLNKNNMDKFLNDDYSADAFKSVQNEITCAQEKIKRLTE